MVKSVVNRIGRITVQSPLCAWPGLGAKPRYQAPNDLRVEIDQIAVINIRLARLSLENGPKLAVGQPNSILKKSF